MSERFRILRFGVSLVDYGIVLERLFLNKCNNFKLGNWNRDLGILLIKLFFERLIFWVDVRLLKFLGMGFLKLLE